MEENAVELAYEGFHGLGQEGLGIGLLEDASWEGVQCAIDFRVPETLFYCVADKLVLDIEESIDNDRTVGLQSFLQLGFSLTV